MRRWGGGRGKKDEQIGEGLRETVSEHKREGRKMASWAALCLRRDTQVNTRRGD